MVRKILLRQPNEVCTSSTYIYGLMEDTITQKRVEFAG